MYLFRLWAACLATKHTGLGENTMSNILRKWLLQEAAESISLHDQRENERFSKDLSDQKGTWRLF